MGGRELVCESCLGGAGIYFIYSAVVSRVVAGVGPVTRRKSRDETETAGHETRHETVSLIWSRDKKFRDETKYDETK